QVRRFVPDQLTRAQYVDNSRRDWDLIVGNYGSGLKATALWLALRALGAAQMKSTDLKSGSGLWTAMEEGRLLLFKWGDSLVGIRGPKGSDLKTMTMLGDGMQF